MSEHQEATFPLRGVDRATPAAQAEPGTCRAIENLVPKGTEQGIRWAIPRAASRLGDGSGVLSLGRHSEGRLVALRAGEVVVIDPANSYSETQVWSFPTSDPSRRATFGRLGEATVVAVTTGDPGRPSRLLEVQGETATPLQWPPLPKVSVSWAEVNGDNVLTYTSGAPFVFRLAWRLGNGALGPSTGPIQTTPGSASGRDGWEVTLTIDEYPRPVPSGITEQLSTLVLVAHAPIKDDNGNVTQEAIEAPGYIVTQMDAWSVGTSVTWTDSVEAIFASDTYDGIGLGAHRRLGGALYTYNKRLILGDVAYDLHRPDLQKIVQWEEGTSNANGDDWHLIMRVQVETTDGIIERLSQPLPFDSSNAGGVNTRFGLVFYPDSRAVRWDFFASPDYSGDISAATWKVPVLTGATLTFQEPQGSSFAYVETSGEPYDITATQTASQEITNNNNWTDQLHSDASAYDSSNGSGSSSDSPHTAEIDLSDFLGTGEDLTGVEVDVSLVYITDEDGSTADADASGEITVEVEDSNPTVVASDTRSAGGSTTLTLSHSALSSGKIRISTQASASASASGSDSATASADVEATEVRAVTSSTTDETVSLTKDVNQTNDRDPARIVWSETNRPISLPPANLAFAGEDDHVMAMAATGQEISAAQFGEYPILVFSTSSVRVLQVGQSPFVQSLDVLTTDAGIVGRRALTPVDGAVAACLDTGVFMFEPQMQQPAVSQPLHDPAEKWLSALGRDVALHFHNAVEENRTELWAATDDRVWSYDLESGAWSTLPRDRRDFVRNDTRPVGVGGSTADVAGALYDETGATASLDFTVITAPLHLGEPGRMERIYEMWTHAAPAVDQLGMNLVALDPDESNAGTAEQSRATMPDGYLAEDLLPHVYLKGKARSKPHQAVLRFAKAYGYAWFAIVSGTGSAPNEAISQLGFEVEPRRRAQPSFTYNVAKP